MRKDANKILVSAIISTYNAENFIRGCLEDLIGQTLYKEGKLEIIIIDSFSKENEKSIVEEFQSKYSNIIYQRTSQRETLYASWNRGIKLARGKYITNSNTDDRHREDALEIMASFLGKTGNKNIDVVYADSFVTERENEIWKTKKIKGVLKWPEYNILHLFDVCYLGPHPMWRKNLHKKFGYFDPLYKSAGDYEYWLRLAVNGAKFAHLNEVLGIYYENKLSISLSNINLNWEESEKARNTHWLPDWGPRPKTNWKSYEIPIPNNNIEHQNNKLLLFCDYFWPSIGGVEVFIEELGRHLIDQGYVVEIACRHLDDRNDFELDGMRIHEFNILKENLISEQEIDKCHNLILKGNYKCVIVLTQPDNWIGGILENLPNSKPRIIMLPSISASNLVEWANNGIGNRVIKILKSVDKIIRVSEEGYDDAFINKFGLKSIYIPHAYEKDDAQIDFRTNYGFSKYRPLLLMVANFWPVKNHDSLLKVLLKTNDNWQIAIIGSKIEVEQKYYEKIVRLVEKDKRVRILGGLDRKITSTAIRDADILLVPSKAESAGPLVVLQAMSFGIPWIATPSCNAVKNEAGGIISPVENFPTAIKYILNNPEVRNKISYLGKKHWDKSFRWDKSLPIFIDLIEGREPVNKLTIPEDLKEQTIEIQNKYSEKMFPSGTKNDKIFSVIIPTYNRSEILEKCLNALSMQNFPFEKFEVIVCDDGSTDNTSELIKQIKSPYQLIYLKQENKGPAAARNMGIRKSTGKYLLILNDDAILNSDALKIHHDTQVKHNGERISVLGIFKLLPEYTRTLLGYLVNSTDILFNYPRMTSGLLYNYKHFYTCNISILKEAVISVGLFNEIFNGPAAEDIELGYRLEQAGYRVLYDESCIAWHDHPFSLRTFCKTHQIRGYGAVTLSYIQPKAYQLQDFNDVELKKSIKSAEPQIEELALKINEIENELDEINLQKNASDFLSIIKLFQNYYVKKGMVSNPYIRKIYSRNIKENPLVSVIIPCYNYGKYLQEAVESVINQTYQDFEIIIVNDGSTDNSTEIANQLVNKFTSHNIKILNQDNSGQPAVSRNNGIKISKGEYILCLDADDKIAPTFLQKCVSVLMENQNISIAYTYRQDFDGVEQIVQTVDYDFGILKDRNIISITSLFRKKSWEDVGGYRTNVKGLEDWDFWIALGAKGHFGQLIREPLFYYRRHDKGLFQEAIRDQKRKIAQIIINNKEIYPPETVKNAENYLDEIKTELAAKLVTVIIPTYNRPGTLYSAIESVLQQNYKNFEIIVVNDAGKNVNDVINKFNDKRLKYFEHKSNKGLAAARNTGLRNATGKYIAYLDDDDIFYPDHLDTLVSFLENNNYSVAYTDSYKAIQELRNGNYITVEKSVPFFNDFSREKLLQLNIAPVLCFMHAKSCIEDVGMFDESLKAHEDWNFWIRISRKYDFAHIKKITAEFRQRTDNSNMTGSQHLDFYNSYRDIVAEHYNLSKNNPAVLNEQINNLQIIKQRTINAGQMHAKEEKPLVSIIIPVYNKVSFTQQCLLTLYKNTSSKIDFEVVVVDNASTDETKEYLGFASNIFNNLRIITNLENLGFARANNLGVKNARGKYLLFLNNDTEVQKGWLESLLKVIENDSSVAAVGSKLLFPDGSLQHAGVIIIKDMQMPDPLVARHLYWKSPGDLKDANQLKTYQALTAACLLIKKNIFEKVDGFDEGFWNGYEDVDLCFKIEELGYSLVYQPESVVIHYESQSGPERFSQVVHNIELLHKKWLGKIKPDFILEKNGDAFKTGANKIKNYILPNNQKQVFKKNKNLPVYNTSIIVLTYNGLDYSKQFIESLQNNTQNKYELLIIDNNSKDGTIEFLKELSEKNAHITLIQNKKNLGFPKAVNQGLKKSKGKYIVIANNDIVVTKGWLERMIKIAESDPQVGLVGPVSNSVSGMQLDKDAKYSTIDEMHNYAAVLKQNNNGRLLEFPRVAFLCTLIKKEVIEKIGGLDERFSPGNFEDDDFCLRAQLAGFKTVIAQDVFIHHYGSKSFAAGGVEKYKARLEANQKIFVDKWGATPEEIWLQGKQIKGRNIMFTLDKNEFTENLQRALSLIEEKEYEVALDYLKNSVEQYNNFEHNNSDPELSNLLNLAGNVSLLNGNLETAQKYFENALNEDKNSSHACAGLGEVLFAAKNYEAAKTMYEWGVKNNPDNKTAVEGLARVNKIFNLPESDNTLFNQNKEQNLVDDSHIDIESDTDRLITEAFEMFNEKKFSEALDKLSQAEKIFNGHLSNPSDPEFAASFHNLKGFNYLGLNDIDNAKACFQKALEINPNSSQAYAGLGEILLKNVDYAKIMFEKAINNNPDNIFALEKIKKIDRFLELNEELSAEPGNNFSESSLEADNKNIYQDENYNAKLDSVLNEVLEASYELFSLKHFSEAIETLNKSEEIFYSQNNKDLITAYENMKGFNYLGLDEKVSARKCFETALNINTESSQACAGLGELFYLDGKDKEAKTMYEFAVKNNPENQYAISGLEKVNKILNYPETHNSLINYE